MQKYNKSAEISQEVDPLKAMKLTKEEKQNLRELDDLLRVPWLVEVDKLNST